MKTKLLLTSVALALPVFAGTPAAQVSAPVPQPNLWSWFAGGSVGYLVDAEEVMYNAHVGVDTPWNLGGWNVAIFAEVGYTEIDDNYQDDYLLKGAGTLTALTNGSGPIVVQTETEIIPITLNVKLERPIADKLNVYFGAGLGVGLVDVSGRSSYVSTLSAVSSDYSDDDAVFTAQVFAGLSYNFCPAFEVYGGARWIYFDDAKMDGDDLDLGDDVLFELGARFNF
jgi:opacity protein-like surface antigen